MAYIFRRKVAGKATGSWFLGYDLPGGQRVQRSLRTRRKAIADQALAQFILEGERQRVGLAARVGLASAVEQFVKSRGNLRANSIKWYETRLGLWLRSLPADLLLEDLTTDSLEEYKVARGREVSLRTVDCDMLALSIFLRWCVEVKKWLPVSPLPRGVRRVVNRGEAGRVALTAEQVAIWGAALRGSAVEPVFLLAAHAGLRLSEIVNLDAEDVGGGLIRVQAKPWRGYVPKDFQEREVPVVAELAGWARSIAKTGPAVPAPDGGRWKCEALQARWRKMRKRLRLPPERKHPRTGKPLFGACIHELRNTFATLHVLRVTDLGTLSEALGHKHISTTDRYFTPQRRRLRQAALRAEKGA